tara:strand:+ start:270 stop:440 length:171 start_codon:yes stop_codon:yes gene_type:complete
MVDLTLKDVKVCFNFLNQFLKHADNDANERLFWNKAYSIDELHLVREKLRLVINNA